MANKSTPHSVEPTPTEFPQTPPPSPAYEPSHVIQSLIELQRSVAALSAKTDRLIADVSDLDGHVDGMRQKIGRAEGIVLAGVVLIGLFAAFVWWLVGGQINSLRDQLISEHQQVQTTPKP